MSSPFPCGFLNVLKPPGMNSHTVVARMRRILGKGKIGHLGTLDPGACGVLPLALGGATRTIGYLPPAGKAYLAELTFGYQTDTLDSFGTVLERRPVGDITRAQLEAACNRYRGQIMQVPPSVSALHVNGMRSYQLVRQGVAVDLPARPAYYQEVSVRSLEWRQGELKAFIHVTCGAGTYVRALIRDLGQDLGCDATMSFLLRTQSGLFKLENAVTLEELANGVEPYLLNVGEVLQSYGIPSLTVRPRRRRPYERRQELNLPQAHPEWSEGQILLLRDSASEQYFGLGRLGAGLQRLVIERLFYPGPDEGSSNKEE